MRRIRRRSKSDDGVFELPKTDIEAAGQIDPDAGILSMIVYWRPKTNSEGVDVGEKSHISIFLPAIVTLPAHVEAWNLLAHAAPTSQYGMSSLQTQDWMDMTLCARYH